MPPGAIFTGISNSYVWKKGTMFDADMIKSNEFSEEGDWTTILRPQRAWFNLNLGEIWQYRDLTLLFVRRDFVAKYKQTILGPAWFIIQPLLTTLMFTVVFGKIAGIPTDGLPPILFYMSGIVVWSYFSLTVTATSGTFISNASIFGKVYFPRIAVPLSLAISGLMAFAIQFFLLIAFMAYYYLQGDAFEVSASVIMLPMLILLVSAQALGIGILVSSLTTKYRDLQHLITFGMQLWMYGTPIVYPLSQVPERYQVFVVANPVTPIIEALRTILFGVGNLNIAHLVYAGLMTTIILTGGIVVFNRVEQRFMDTV